jgi:hypothetical protein
LIVVAHEDGFNPASAGLSIGTPTEIAPPFGGLSESALVGHGGITPLASCTRFPATASVLARINSVAPWWGWIESAYRVALLLAVAGGKVVSRDSSSGDTALNIPLPA